MQYLYRKVCTEDLITRESGPLYGSLTATSIYINVYIEQDLKNIGLATDTEYVNESWSTNQSLAPIRSANNTSPFVATNTGIINIVSSAYTVYSAVNITVSGWTDDLRIKGETLNDIISIPVSVSAITDSKLGNYQSYNVTNPYIAGFDIDANVYVNLSGQTITGVSRVTTISATSVSYVSDVDKNDAYIGTTQQSDGFLYTDYEDPADFYDVNKMSSIIDPSISSTKLDFKGQGWNQSNTSFSAITREESFFGLSDTPTVSSDILIDRGNVSPMATFMRLGEITSIDDFDRYGGKFFKVVKQQI